MKKKKHIGLWVLVGVVVLLGAAAYWQKDNIGLAMQLLKSSPESVETQAEESREKLQDSISGGSLTVREPTEDEKKALKDGSLSREELIRKLIEPEETREGNEKNPETEKKDYQSDTEKNIINDTDASGAGKPQKTEGSSGETAPAENTAPPTENTEQSAEPTAPPAENTEQPAEITAPPQEETAQTEEADESEEYRQKLSALLAEAYVLEEEFDAKLQDMVEQAKQEYRGMTKEERSKSALLKWAGGYVSRATDMEKECDAEVNELAGRMLTLIHEYQGDESVVRAFTENYASEKNLKKSQYLAELKNRGLLG